MNTKSIVVGLVIALVLSAGMASALSNSGGGDWQYYREITIKENSGTPLSGYQVLIELNSANFDFSNAESDGSDIRFTDASGNELNYWIEEWNAGSRSAKIWVKVSSVPSRGETKIWMYYGNPSAGTMSNGDSTFEFFDDFAGTSLDTNKWDSYTTGSGTITVGNEYVKLYTSGSYSHFIAQITSKRLFNVPAILEFEFKQEGNGYAPHSIFYKDDSNYIAVHETYRSDYEPCLFVSTAGSVSKETFSPKTSADRWYDGKLVITPDYQGCYYRDGIEKASKTLGFTANKVKIRHKQVGAFDYGSTYYISKCRIRQYASIEPTITLSAEYLTQKLPAITLTKSASPSSIQEGETTTISIRVQNTGSGDAKTVEVIDTIPMGFKIISGSKSESFGEIKSRDYRTLEYTLKATGSGKFTCDPATATYTDADGNSYSTASNAMSLQVGGEVPVGADSDGDGWSDAKEQEMGTNPYSVDSDSDGLRDPEDPNPTVPEEGKGLPGFEAVFAIAGLLAVAYLVRKREVIK